MRYMFLIYSRERDVSQRTNQELDELKAAHWSVMDEAWQRGVFVAAGPLKPTATAKTVRMDGGTKLVTDGPFAETKEQLAGYYILDCRDEREALDWAAKIPTACKGGEGCIEVRPMSELSERVT